LHDDLFTLSERLLEVGQVAIGQSLVPDGVRPLRAVASLMARLQRGPVGLEVDQFLAAAVAFNQRLAVVAGGVTSEAVVHHCVATR
jgi:hypothetical protein